jgi:hypothetical protein
VRKWSPRRDDAAGLIVNRGDVGRADVAAFIDPDRSDASGAEEAAGEIVVIAAALAHAGEHGRHAG